MRTITTAIHPITLALIASTLLYACSREKMASSQSIDGQTADSPAEVVHEELGGTVKDNGTVIPSPTPLPSPKPEQRSQLLLRRKVKKFLRSPENAVVIQELHSYILANNPTLIPTTPATSRAEKRQRMNDIVTYLDANRSHFSPEAQALLDRIDAFKQERQPVVSPGT